MYSINFTKDQAKFCLSLHYNGADSYLFFNGTEIIKFKATYSEIVATPLSLGNIPKDWSIDNMGEMFMILMLIMMPLQLMIYQTLTII